MRTTGRRAAFGLSMKSPPRIRSTGQPRPSQTWTRVHGVAEIGAQGFDRFAVWATVLVGVLVLALVWVLGTGMRPGYDPFGWLTWGHAALRFDLERLGRRMEAADIPLCRSVRGSWSRVADVAVDGHGGCWGGSRSGICCKDCRSACSRAAVVGARGGWRHRHVCRPWDQGLCATDVGRGLGPVDRCAVPWRDRSSSVRATEDRIRGASCWPPFGRPEAAPFACLYAAGRGGPCHRSV